MRACGYEFYLLFNRKGFVFDDVTCNVFSFVNFYPFPVVFALFKCMHAPLNFLTSHPPSLVLVFYDRARFHSLSLGSKPPTAKK